MLNNGGADPSTERGGRPSIPSLFHWFGNLRRFTNLPDADAVQDRLRLVVHGSALNAVGFYTRERFVAASNNRDRFSCVIIQANPGVVHLPSLQQSLCRAEFNPGDE